MKLKAPAPSSLSGLPKLLHPYTLALVVRHHTKSTHLHVRDAVLQDGDGAAGRIKGLDALESVGSGGKALEEVAHGGGVLCLAQAVEDKGVSDL